MGGKAGVDLCHSECRGFMFVNYGMPEIVLIKIKAQ
jgi:hypothetical protein